MSRKIIDFKIDYNLERVHGILVVLCDDGTLWEKSKSDPSGWKPFPEVPQPEKENPFP